MNPSISRLLLFATIVAVDQFTKALTVAYFSERTGLVEIGVLLNLVHVRNYGIGFGLLGTGGSWQQWGLAVFALAVGLALLVMQARTPQRLYATGLTLIASGAVGNAICRLGRGSVVDFIDFHVSDYHWPAFNVADIAITVGAAGVVIHTLPLKAAIGRLRSRRRGP